MQAFKRIKLGQALTFQRGFDITKAEQTHGSIPIVSSSGVSSYHNVAKVDPPGIIIGRKGTLGTVHSVNTPFWPHDTTLWVKDFKGNDSRFLYYFFEDSSLGELRYWVIQSDVESKSFAQDRSSVPG